MRTNPLRARRIGEDKIEEQGALGEGWTQIREEGIIIAEGKNINKGKMKRGKEEKESVRR